MKHIRALFVSLIGAIAICAAASASASAVLPEVGRCVKAPVPGTGEYEVASCTGGAKATGGKYDWNPGAVKNKFVSVGGITTLGTTSGFTITCKTVVDEGEYTSPETVFVPVIRLLGCEPMGGGVCQNAATREIVISAHGGLGFIKNVVIKGKLVLSVGVDLEPFEATTIICEGPGVGAPLLSLFGSVIAPITPIDKMTGKFTLKYTATKGKQKPQKFEGAPKDTLSLERVATKVVEEAGLTSIDSITNEELLEVKAKP